MCSVRDLFRVIVSESLVNGSANRVGCDNGRTGIAGLLVLASCLVGSKSTIK